MLAVKEAKELINKASIPGIDAVYTFNLPAEVVGNTDKTVIRLTDANTKQTLWGSNDFNALNREIEVQIFYKLNPETDPEVTESKLYRLFVNAGWDLGENRGHTFDPETNQITTSFYVYSLEILGGN